MLLDGDAGGVSDSNATSAAIIRLIGVYDADGTLRGEVAYWVGARLGRRHCSLCDITHGLFTPRTEWNACRDGLPVPFDTFHRNDQPHQVRLAVQGAAPVVVAETADGIVPLLDPATLDACAGSIDHMVTALERAVVELGLLWPTQNP